MDLGTASTFGVMEGVVVVMSGGEERAGGTDDMERQAGQEAKTRMPSRSRVFMQCKFFGVATASDIGDVIYVPSLCIICICFKISRLSARA